MSDSAVVPVVAVGSEAVRLAKSHRSSAPNKEARAERLQRVVQLKREGYSYAEIATLIGVSTATVGYYAQKAEGSLPPSSLRARAAGERIGKLTGKPVPAKKGPAIVSDFQREALLEGLADSLWSRLSVSDKVRVIQHVGREDANNNS